LLGLRAAPWSLGVIVIGAAVIGCSSDAGLGAGGAGGSGGAGGARGGSGGTGAGGAGSAGAGGAATGGSAGDGGTTGASGGTGITGPRTCMRFHAGCSCEAGEPADDERPCTTTSAATMPGDVGVCCEGPAVCKCTPYICRNDASQGFCTCGVSTTITGVVQGDVVTTCPLPTGNQKCCYSRELASCTCSELDCTTRWVSVPSCSIGDVTVCVDSGPSVAMCSTISAGTDGGSDAADDGASDAADDGG